MPSLYDSSTLSNVNQDSLQLFKKAKKDLEMLPPTRGTLKLHILRANYKAKFWLQADHEHIQISSPHAKSAWIKGKKKVSWLLCGQHLLLSPGNASLNEERLDAPASGKVSSALLTVTAMQQPIVTQQPQKMQMVHLNFYSLFSP